MAWPSDVVPPPDEIINCRCSLVPLTGPCEHVWVARPFMGRAPVTMTCVLQTGHEGNHVYRFNGRVYAEEAEVEAVRSPTPMLDEDERKARRMTELFGFAGGDEWTPEEVANIGAMDANEVQSYANRLREWQAEVWSRRQWAMRAAANALGMPPPTRPYSEEEMAEAFRPDAAGEDQLSMRAQLLYLSRQNSGPYARPKPPAPRARRQRAARGDGGPPLMTTARQRDLADRQRRAADEERREYAAMAERRRERAAEAERKRVSKPVEIEPLRGSRRLELD